MSVTDEDRERAAELYLGCRKTAYHRQEATAAIAQVIAAERERVRAPFLALADELKREGQKEEAEAKRLGKSVTAESWWGSGAASLDASERIRRLAEES